MVSHLQQRNEPLFTFVQNHSKADCYRCTLVVIGIILFVTALLAGILWMQSDYYAGLAFTLGGVAISLVLTALGVCPCARNCCKTEGVLSETGFWNEIETRSQNVGDRLSLLKIRNSLAWNQSEMKSVVNAAINDQEKRLDKESTVKCFLWHLSDSRGHVASLIGYSPHYLWSSQRTPEQNNTITVAPEIDQAFAAAQKVYFDSVVMEKGAHINPNYWRIVHNPEPQQATVGRPICQRNELLYLSLSKQKDAYRLLDSDDIHGYAQTYVCDNHYVAEIYDAVQGLNFEALKTYYIKDKSHHEAERTALATSFSNKIVASLNASENALFAIGAPLTPELLNHLSEKGVRAALIPLVN